MSHKALTHWMDVLESMYHVFRIRPLATPRSRTLTKMPKPYLWDRSLVADRAARLENLVASHLLKLGHFLEDAEGHAVELRFVRDREDREVDFLVLAGRKPWFLVEVKHSARDLSPALGYFQKLTGCPHAFQVVTDAPYVDRDCFTYTSPVIVPA